MINKTKIDLLQKQGRQNSSRMIKNEATNKQYQTKQRTIIMKTVDIENIIKYIRNSMALSYKQDVLENVNYKY